MSTDEHTGRELGELDTVRQAVHRVVRTPLHTRPMTPRFGTDQVALAALPMNPIGTARLAGEVAKAITRWEPRASVERAQFAGDMGGRVSATITARADGVPFEVDMRSTETLGDMRLHPDYLWEHGSDWTPALGDPAQVSADGPSRVFDGLTTVEITGLDFGAGVPWTLMLEMDLPGGPTADLLSVVGAVVSQSNGTTSGPGLPSFDVMEDLAPGADFYFLAGYASAPRFWFWLSHDGMGRVTAALGEISTTRVATGPLPAATVLALGPAAMTVHRLAYWRRELTARERVGVFRECQRDQ